VSEDPRLANFRLVHVRGERDADPSWRTADGNARSARRLADAVKEGDAPVRALDFLFLRCMGLIRFHRGMYQVALAKDLGFTAALTEDEARTTRRVHTFAWRDLNPDIERAHELLRLELAKDAELELFLSPFLGRIRVGQSPRVIAQALVRASHYAQGKDPSPWPSQPEEGTGAEYRATAARDWLERVVQAGSRAPRAAITEAQADPHLGDTSGRFALPSSLTALELDEDALVYGAGILEFEHLVGGGAAAGDFAQSSLAARLVTTGDLARHVEAEHAVLGVGRSSVLDFHEHEALRATARTLGIEARRAGKAILEGRRVVRHLQLAWAPLKKKDLPQGSRAVDPLKPTWAPPKPKEPLQGVTPGHLEPFAPALAGLLGQARALLAVAEDIRSLRAQQEAVLAPAHADVLASLRAEVEALRLASVGLVEICNSLRRRALEVKRLPAADAGGQAAEDKQRQEDELQRLGEALKAHAAQHVQQADAAAGELVKRLRDAGRAGADPELLAALLGHAEVARGAGERHEQEARLLEEVRGASQEAGEEAEKKVPVTALARSRRLVATHRLARLRERQGNAGEAKVLLASISEARAEEFPYEHRSAVLAHRIVAHHALARMTGAGTDAEHPFERAIKDARECLGLPVLTPTGAEKAAVEKAAAAEKSAAEKSAAEKSATVAAPEPVRLTAEHRAIIRAHAVLMEHAYAAEMVLQGGVRLDRAICWMEALLADRKAWLGWEHPDTLAMALDLAAALRRRGRTAAASSNATPGQDDVQRADLVVEAVRGGHAPGSLFDPLEARPDTFNPRDLLAVPFETAGWSARNVSGGEGYEVVDLPMWLHGLYDALDGDAVRATKFEESLVPKLKRFGELCFRGLLDLFWELRNLERPPRSDDEGVSDVERENDLLLQQSTDLIAEVLFRNVKDDPRPPIPTRVEALSLPEGPTELLRSLAPPGMGDGAGALRGLDARLAELGALPPGALGEDPRVYWELPLAPKADRTRYDFSLRELRQQLRRLVQRLLDVGFLSSVSERSVGKSPRLQVFIAADLGEPVVRATLVDVISAMHAEFIHAFRAVFKEYRGGFERNLSIIPLLWYPNPSAAEPKDPRETEDFVRAVRHEEASMLQAVLDLRRAVFRAASRERFVPTVYVSSRVTDGGVLSVQESVQQTHDFIHLCARSDMGKDDWLRSVLMGPYGRDAFGTFGCVELDLPVDRIREYFAGRLARMVMGELLDDSVEQRAELVDPARDGQRAALEARLDTSAEGVHAELGSACERLARKAVAGYEPVEEDPDPVDVLAQHADAKGEEVSRVILGGWHESVAPGCTMDLLMQDLRVEARGVAREATRLVRERSDETVASVARGKALNSPVLRLAAFAGLESKRVEEQTEALDDAQALALAEQLPDPLRAILPAFAAVRTAAEAVPRRPWLRAAEVAMAPLGFALAAVAGYALSLRNGWYLQPGIAEVLATRVLPWLGALGAVALTHAVLEWHRRRRTAGMRAAMEEAVEAVRRVVMGARNSIQSFLDARISFLVASIRRGVAARSAEQAHVDAQLARRLKAGAEAAERDLRRHAEVLGVHAEGPCSFGQPPVDGLERLVEQPGRARSALLDPEAVLGYWHDRLGPPSSQRTFMPGVLALAAPVAGWRSGEWFARREQLLGFGRQHFAELLDEQVCEHPRFAGALGQRVDAVARRSAAQLGFPGYLKGSEGLDDDGVLILAEADLVLRPRLAALLPEGRSDIRVRTVPVRTHAAYLLTLAQGVAPQLPLMHRRHMGHYDNAFVWKGDEPPAHILTGMEEGVKSLYARFGRDENKKP
jgi:hypothetical protein